MAAASERRPFAYVIVIDGCGCLPERVSVAASGRAAAMSRVGR